MKVDIRKYPDTWWRSTVHYNYMNKKYSYDWDENNTTFEVFLDKLEEALQSVYNATINKLINKRKRVIKVKIEDFDVWNADNTLAYIIHPVLVKIRNEKQGTPNVDDEDVPEHIRSTASKQPKENEWDSDEFFRDRWDYVLGEMIYAFECELDDEWEEQFYSGEIDYIHVPDTHNGMKVYRMEHGPNHTFKVDTVAEKRAWARRDEGRRLFAKYYHSLWT